MAEKGDLFTQPWTHHGKRQSKHIAHFQPSLGYRVQPIVIGNCPHLKGGLSCKALLFLWGSFSPLS
jgi:hypothetical protein